MIDPSQIRRDEFACHTSADHHHLRFGSAGNAQDSLLHRHEIRRSAVNQTLSDHRSRRRVTDQQTTRFEPCRENADGSAFRTIVDFVRWSVRKHDWLRRQLEFSEKLLLERLRRHHLYRHQLSIPGVPIHRQRSP